MPKISIIIPNKNYERFLRSALDSVKHQTFTDWECIVIDDASVDKSCDIIQEYVNADNRFKLIKMPQHAGISVVRNAGLDAASGEYIAFLDADDAYAQNALETLYIAAQMTGAEIVNGFAQNVDDAFKFAPATNAAFVPTGISTFVKPGLYLAHNTPDQNWFWLWRRLYKRSVIGDVRFDLQLNDIGEDIGFTLNVTHRARLMAEVPVVVAYHRMHFNSVSKRTSCPDCMAYLTVILNTANSLIPHYEPMFWHIFYNMISDYIVRECVVKPRVLKAYLDLGRKTMIQCAQIMPRKYLTRKKRFMFWYLSRLKHAQD